MVLPGYYMYICVHYIAREEILMHIIVALFGHLAKSFKISINKAYKAAAICFLIS